MGFFVCVFGVLASPMVRTMFSTPESYMSARFALLVIMAIVNGFCVRVDGFNIFRRLSANPMFLVVAFGVIACTVLCVSFGGAVLQLSPLDTYQWLVVLCLSLLIIPINFARLILRQGQK